MKKPIIAIFCTGNLPTKKEQSIINSLAHYPCVILNAETYTPQDSLIVDAVIGVVPEHLKHLPDPDTVIAQYEEYLEGVGDDVGGNPPEPPSDEKGNGEVDTPKDGDNAEGEQPKATTAFGTPPTPPSNKK